MADRVTSGTSTDAALMSEAFSVARELLQRAEEDAARIRADADRYVRQREQEAELLVGKARRLLEVAEQTAASIAVGPAVTWPRTTATGSSTSMPRPRSVAACWCPNRSPVAATSIGSSPRPSPRPSTDTFPIDPLTRLGRLAGLMQVVTTLG